MYFRIRGGGEAREGGYPINALKIFFIFLAVK